MSQFINGHALVIGVGADLPVTVEDATAIATMLEDPERCAYPPSQVTLLTEKGASRKKIVESLEQLATRATPEASVVIYFSGHGYEITTITGKAYFLMPYGYDINSLPSTAISGPELMRMLAAIPSKRMLILFDCCHAGGMDDSRLYGTRIVKAPLPSEGLELFAQGSGRVIIASCRADEKSLTGKPYSEFTNAIVAALAGAGTAEKDGYVRAADLAMHAREVVPKVTNDFQHPVMHFEQSDNFIVSYYAAGNKEPKELPKHMRRTEITQCSKSHTQAREVGLMENQASKSLRS